MCKYEIQKSKTENPINDHLDPSSSDNETYRETISDTESDNESNEQLIKIKTVF